MTDPENNIIYNRLYGALVAYTNVHDIIAEILVLSLDEVYKSDSPEYAASSDTLQGMQYLIDIYRSQVAEEMEKILKDS